MEQKPGMKQYGNWMKVQSEEEVPEALREMLEEMILFLSDENVSYKDVKDIRIINKHHEAGPMPNYVTGQIEWTETHFGIGWKLTVDTK